MASINKLLPRSLNTDDDERLIQATEMTDAQNIRVSIDAEEDALVLKNAWGNIQRSATIENGSFPSGESVCIGGVGDDTQAQVYYFVWNSGGNHTIFRYDQNSKKTYIVYQDEVLNFSKEGFVYASIVRLSNNNTILYFNDGVNEPKKVNATRAEQSISGAGGYPNTFTGGTIQQRTNYITVAKQPPLSPPTITFSHNSAYPQNDIFEKNFQFAYQYEYYDGEQSALSPYSELSISASQLKDGFINAGARNYYNQINIKINNSELDVKDINVYARIGDKDAPFFQIDNVPNVHGSGTQTINFRNDANYIGLSATVQDKFYDNVPQKADSQAISQGRLFYGGYTEGYDNLTEFDVGVTANYYNKPDTYNIEITNYGQDSSGRQQIKMDYSNIPSGGLGEDSKILLSFTWNDGAIAIRNTLGNDKDFNFTETGLSAMSSFKFFEDSAGNNSTSLSQSEKMIAIGGFRYKVDGVVAEAGLNVDGGTLNGPPNIRFVAQKGTSDTREETVPLKKIDKGIKVISSGFQVRKIIDIPHKDSNGQINTRDKIKQIVANQVAGLYPIQFTPQEGEIGFSKCTTGYDTRTTVETAAFSGVGNVWFRRTSFASTFDVYTLSVNQATMRVDKLVFGTKETEILNADGVACTFDIIEQNIDGLLPTIPSFTLKRTANGLYVTHNGQVSGKNATIDRTGGYITSGGCFAIANDDMDGYRCFKSGASHEFGVVYFDDKGRPSGVQPIPDDVFVKHTNNRSSENDLDGHADITFRLRHTAPDWAERYSIVYAGQGSIVNKVQYSIGGAYLALNDDAEGSFGAAQNIYLSLGTLQSRSNSYDNQLGAMINYGFAEGDRLRIVRYGDDQKETATWKISRFETLLADSATNPILDRSSKASILNTTGDFIVIEDNGTPYFNTSSILKDISRWNKQCVIEIYRESPAFEETFYYEIAANLSVDDNGVHQTQRPGTSISIKVSSQNGNEVVAEVNKRVYKGDIIKTTGGDTIIVGNVINNDDTTYPFKFYGDTQDTWTPTNVYSMTVTNPDSMVRVDQGDSYFRLRSLFYGAAPKKGDVWRNISAAYSQNALVDFIEDPRVSDFYTSSYTSLGKSFAYLPDNRRIKRYGSITYSDPFSFENTILGLSSFNLTTQNFKDLSYDYGSISSLVPYDEYLYIVHERRAGIVPVGRNILTANDGESLTATNQVLGPVKYYTGEYGCNSNPESVAWYRGYVFFVDAKAGKVVRLNYQTGLDVISEQNVDSFFKSRMFSTSITAKNRLYRAGIDRENYEYIISSPALYTSALEITDSCSGRNAIGYARTNEDGNIINVSAIYDNTLTLYFNSDPRNWECAEDDWDDSGKGLLLIDQLTNNAIVGISEDMDPMVTGIVQNVPILMTSSAYEAFHTGVYSQSKQEVAADPDAQSTFIITSTSETLGGFSIAYDIRSNYWSTRYSYIAETLIGLSDRLYTFSRGHIYEHSPDATRNTFYGVAGDSIVECISNFNPSMVKVYEAMSLEGNNKDWTVTLTNSDQTSTIANSIWQEKENFYYAPIHQDSSNNIDYTATANVSSLSGTSEVFGIGTVASIATDKITFKNAINSIGFPVGNTTALFKVSGTNLVPLNLYAVSVSGEKELECHATVSGLVADDEIVLIADSAIEGDSIRDYYLKAKLVNSTTSAHELYAVNFIYAKSNLHNQQGQ
jgi:hypothetical protein